MRRAPILGMIGFAIWMLMAAYGCGGGTTELTKAEFVKQADAICVDTQKQLSKALSNGPSPESKQPEQAQAVLYGATAEALQTEVDEIGELGAPSTDADEIDAILESASQVATTLEESEGELDKEAVDKSTTQMAETEQQAEAYGFKSCLLT